MTRFQKHMEVGVVFLMLAALLAGCATHGGQKVTAGPSAKASPSVAAATTAQAVGSAQSAPAPSATLLDPTRGEVIDGWITSIPACVPKFGHGALDRGQSKIVVGSVSTMFSLSYRNVKKADVDSYAQALKQKGYLVAADKLGDAYTLTASLDTKDGAVTLVLSLNESSGVAGYVLGAPV